MDKPKAEEGLQAIIDVASKLRMQARADLFGKLRRDMKEALDEIMAGAGKVREALNGVPAETTAESDADYTRADLVNICEDAIIEHEEWKDAKTGAWQERIGRLWMLLRSGCRYEVMSESQQKSIYGDQRVDAEDTIVLKVWFRGENFWNTGIPRLEFFLLPTAKKLEETDGDWT